MCEFVCGWDEILYVQVEYKHENVVSTGLGLLTHVTTSLPIGQAHVERITPSLPNAGGDPTQ